MVRKVFTRLRHILKSDDEELSDLAEAARLALMNRDLPKAAQIYLHFSELILEADDAPEVVPILTVTADLLRKVGDREHEIDIRRRLAEHLVSLQDWEASLTELSRVAELSSTLGDAPDEALAYMQIAVVLIQLERDEESLPFFKRADEVLHNVGDDELWIAAQDGWLTALESLQRWDDILDRCDAIVARTRQRSAPEFRDIALRAHHLRARGLALRGEWADALIHARYVIEQATERDEHHLEIYTRLILARALRETEHVEEALEEFERLLRRARMPNDAEYMTQALAGLGSVLQKHPQLGVTRFRELAHHYEASGDRYLEGLCHYWCGNCLNELRPIPDREAADEYVKAARLLDASGADREAGEAYYRAATSLRYRSLQEMELREESFHLYDMAAARFAATGNWWGKGLAEFSSIEVLRKEKLSDPEDPRRLTMARRAVRSFTKASRPVDAADARVAVAIQFSFQDRMTECIRSTLVALRGYEEGRRHLLLPYKRVQNDEQIARAFSVLVSKILGVARDKQADPWWQGTVWGLAQVTRGRSFQDQRQQNEVWNYLLAKDQPLRQITGTVEDLTRQLDALDTELRIQERNALEQVLRNAERAQHKRFDMVSEQQPTTMAVASIAPASVAEIQSGLKPGEVHIAFLRSGGSLARILIQPGISCSITVPELTRTGAFEEWLQEGKEWGVFAAPDPDQDDEAINTEMATLILGQIPEGTDTLIISPQGSLVGIPWHQLSVPDSEEPTETTGDRYAIGIVPAAGAFLQLRSTERTVPEATYLGIACNGDGRIPQVDFEVNHIAESYFAAEPTSQSLTTKQCSTVFALRRAVQLLHLACHAGRGGLLLSQDGRWTTPVDLLDWGLRADILLLTGCNAGKFAEYDNNEFLGIVRQLLVVTHARAAIVSVHPVPDAAGVLFSDLVVTALTNIQAGRPWSTPGKPLPVGRAVEWARHQLRELNPEAAERIIPRSNQYIDPADPLWWSPWFVVGDPAVTLDLNAVRKDV